VGRVPGCATTCGAIPLSLSVAQRAADGRGRTAPISPIRFHRPNAAPRYAALGTRSAVRASVSGTSMVAGPPEKLASTSSSVVSWHRVNA
jgi:hypothetical protein